MGNSRQNPEFIANFLKFFFIVIILSIANGLLPRNRGWVSYFFIFFIVNVFFIPQMRIPWKTLRVGPILRRDFPNCDNRKVKVTEKRWSRDFLFSMFPMFQLEFYKIISFFQFYTKNKMVFGWTSWSYFFYNCINGLP